MIPLIVISKHQKDIISKMEGYAEYHPGPGVGTPPEMPAEYPGQIIGMLPDFWLGMSELMPDKYFWVCNYLPQSETQIEINIMKIIDVYTKDSQA